MMKEDLSNENQEVCSIADCPPYPEAYHNFDTDSPATGKSHRIKIRCDDSHSHAVEINGGNQNAYVIGIDLRMAFVVTEVIAAFHYNSMALLIDAGHNLGDVTTLVISLVTFKIAKKQASAGYTYGFKKITVLASFVNALALLISIGILGSGALMGLFKPQVASGCVIAYVAGSWNNR